MTMTDATSSSLIRTSVLILTMTAAGCHGDAGKVPTATEPLEVHTTHPSMGSITRSITLPAQVLAERQVTLYSKVAGYLQAITVDKGDNVASGAVIARIEMPELMSARARQRAEVAAADADYDRLQESLAKAPDLVVPQMVEQARGKRDVARANLEQSDTMLRYATISAPFSGVITQRFVDPGALIQTGTASGAAIVTLMDFSKVRLQVAVPEIEAGKVAVGEPVAVSSDSVAGTSFDGKIARFSYALDNASRTMLAEVSLNNPKLLLRPGMLVTAKIGIEHKESTLILPLEAVVTDKTGSYAYLLSDGKANKRPIKTGFKDAKEVEVLEGLTVADEVILASKLTLSNGQAVKLAAAQ